MVATRDKRAPTRRAPGFTSFEDIDLTGDEEELGIYPRKRARRNVASEDELLSAPSDNEQSRSSAEPSDEDEMDIDFGPRRSRRVLRTKQKKAANRPGTRRTLRSSHLLNDEEDEEEASQSSDDDSDLLRFNIKGWKSRKRKRPQASKLRLSENGLYFHRGNRRSERTTRAQRSMEEIGVDRIERSGSESAAPTLPKARGAKEVFKPLPRGNAFRERHMQVCDSCGNANNTAAALIYCQGCSLAYHKGCVGPRGNRDHLVSKVGDQDFVLQCRRCINTYKKKDDTAPDLTKCQDCRERGLSCAPLRVRKTMLQEQKDREENDGEDPIVDVDPFLINNPDNVLFRCVQCARGFHFHHLPSRDPYALDHHRDDRERAEVRFNEYARDWRCKECVEAPAKLDSIVAWRPLDPETYNPGVQVGLVEEDEKEYLIKWEGLSYFRAEWRPGAWVWGISAFGTRKKFFKNDPPPKMRTEDAIPEEFLRIDIVLDVKYSNIIDIRTDEIDRARIKEVDTALIKYKGLGYEDAVWERVPGPEDGDRWTDFVTAYNDWVLGRYTHVPKGQPLKTRLEKARALQFTKLEKKKQPDNLIGGELMKYQVEGLNWLYYQWHQQKNGILADEMGLGKTIQVISFLAMMVEDHHCWPFLIVVPNSTCPNWRREIKQWAPQLRVVTYYGSTQAREMAYKYEMFPENSRDMRCHVVVTSYDAAADDSCRKFFLSVPWRGLIVDEGQRLKNDRSQLHNVLRSLKIPFRILLTGTPLQNNARELFNLLQFLDDTIDAAAMEEEYAEMTNEKIAKLHELIRPFILRRTKAQVLTFLPPMAQIILPLSMSVLQAKLYKSILAKNPELICSIFTHNTLKPAERASLNNTLMQLRKCLAHPFVYSQEIEERHQSAAVLHRNLVEASSKLQLLEVLLPKLQERGHRVLIFSQFLEMLTIMEDFLDGLQMRYQRLDGSVSSLEKQKRIDEFNAPDSPLFAFLLSTRAGGVGINLATADTVIILDPDFNPHQDIQAISRAHRIGQTKKVLCFQLMTRATAEEKIVQIGRKKMALDHVVVEQLDAEDLEEKDVESILRHGATELFQDGSPEQEIKYDAASADRLLDRSQIENTKAGEDNSAESQFSFARVWANDQAALADSLNASEDETPPDPGVWDKILKERAAAAAAEAAARAEAYGRGRRAKAVSILLRYDISTDIVRLSTTALMRRL
jgi:chromodomain-helicase-DNA-binding protein 4